MTADVDGMVEVTLRLQSEHKTMAPRVMIRVLEDHMREMAEAARNGPSLTDVERERLLAARIVSWLQAARTERMLGKPAHAGAYAKYALEAAQEAGIASAQVSAHTLMGRLEADKDRELGAAIMWAEGAATIAERECGATDQLVAWATLAELRSEGVRRGLHVNRALVAQPLDMALALMTTAGPLESTAAIRTMTELQAMESVILDNIGNHRAAANLAASVRDELSEAGADSWAATVGVDRASALWHDGEQIEEAAAELLRAFEVSQSLGAQHNIARIARVRGEMPLATALDPLDQRLQEANVPYRYAV